MSHPSAATPIAEVIAQLITFYHCPHCQALTTFAGTEYAVYYDALACPNCHAILREDLPNRYIEFPRPSPLRIAPSCPGVEGAEPLGGEAAPW